MIYAGAACDYDAPTRSTKAGGAFETGRAAANAGCVMGGR
jgi:hypothetical protein